MDLNNLFVRGEYARLLPLGDNTDRRFDADADTCAYIATAQRQIEADAHQIRFSVFTRDLDQSASESFPRVFQHANCRNDVSPSQLEAQFNHNRVGNNRPVPHEIQE